MKSKIFKREVVFAVLALCAAAATQAQTSASVSIGGSITAPACTIAFDLPAQAWTGTKADLVAMASNASSTTDLYWNVSWLNYRTDIDCPSPTRFAMRYSDSNPADAKYISDDTHQQRFGLVNTTANKPLGYAAFTIGSSEVDGVASTNAVSSTDGGSTWATDALPSYIISDRSGLIKTFNATGGSSNSVDAKSKISYLSNPRTFIDRAALNQQLGTAVNFTTGYVLTLSYY